MKTLKFALLFVFAAAGSLRAETWYVRPSAGDDSNAGTTWSQAFATLGAACNFLEAGDAVVVGTLSPLVPDTAVENVIWTKSGSLWAIDEADSLTLKRSRAGFVLGNNSAGAFGQDLLKSSGAGVRLMVYNAILLGDLDGSGVNTADRLFWASNSSEMEARECTAMGGEIGFTSTFSGVMNVYKSTSAGANIGYWSNTSGSKLFASDCWASDAGKGYMVQNGGWMFVTSSVSQNVNDGFYDVGTDTTSMIVEYCLVDNTVKGVRIENVTSEDSSSFVHMTLVNCDTAFVVDSGEAFLSRSILAYNGYGVKVWAGLLRFTESLVAPTSGDISDATVTQPMLYATPLFVGAKYGDWHLHPGSPGVHAWGLHHPLGAFATAYLLPRAWGREAWSRSGFGR